ncbi:serine protease [Streptomyces mirabilis]|uniref:S1 family peptidase n=1 Tax=Streptomyces mirabilis TaxID=68239 RepID=UPI00362C09CF
MQFYGRLVLALARVENGNVRLLGSCFPAGPAHLATALHVVSPNDDNLCVFQPAVLQPTDYQKTSQTSWIVHQVKISAVDAIRDICILKPPPDWEFQFAYTLSGTDALRMGDEVHVYGYPHMEYGRKILTVQRSHVGSKVLIANHGVEIKHAVINTQLRPGQSGGPVFDVNTETLCGMVTGNYAPDIKGSIFVSGVDPVTLHQTGHAISAEYIKDMIQ